MSQTHHRRPRLRFSGLVAAALACVAALQLAALPVARLAVADEAVERATAKVIKAQALYKSGQFAKAAEEYLVAYGISPRAVLLFNAARAYEEAALADEAIALYERYLTLKDADADGRKDAEKRLHALRDRRGFGPKVDPPVADRAVAVTPSPLPTGPLAATGRDRPLAPPPAAAADDGSAGERNGRKDGAAETNTVMWYALGCVAVGLPVAWVAQASPPMARVVGRSVEYTASYTHAYRQSANDKRRDFALYGCLTSAGVIAIAAVLRGGL